MNNQGIITIAAGKKYAKYAKFLAYSCIINSPNTLRCVITDLPDELSPYYDIVIPFPNNLNPFSLKTQLFHYTPFEKTIYIDSDSLVITNLDSLFDISGNQYFSYNGTIKTTGLWYFNIEQTINKLNLKWIPEFNSGMFIFDKSDNSKQIFDYAYNSLMNYDSTEIQFFRSNMLPDEPFFSLALSKYELLPFDDYSRFSRTLINAEKINVNVIKGIAHYYKDDKPVFPCIVHFCGRLGNIVYFFQKIKLSIYFNFSIANLFLKPIIYFRNKRNNNNQ